MPGPSAKSGLISILMECIIYGIYITVFLRTFHILRRKVEPGFVFAYLAGTALVLFALITLRLIVDITITVQTLTAKHGPIPASRELEKLSCGAHVSLTTIADIFIIYRVFAVWSRSLLSSAIPCLLLVAGITSGGLLIANTGKYGFNEPRSLFTAYYCITLVLNVLCTVLIASKLYISERRTKLSSSLKLKWTSVIVIESAALYSASVIVVVVCNVLRADDAHLIVLLMTPPIIGLTFSLIILRIARLNRSASKTFTSIDISRGSVLQFAMQPRTVDGADIGINACLNGQSSEKVTVATITATTVQSNSVPCIPADDVENQLSERDGRSRE
ncbi:hypothetical protein PQX77_001035 [Marasmius sp. AFHP31]|nr:hypothetical protein PQX77_012091 [Marasmius sp. AFHP31]KAK1235728.1 hypothetical protein PQX77_001035 [Marasmius sp. AFHP31]